MMEVIGLVLCVDWAGLSVSSPVVEVRRTVNDSPYMSADASTLRRDVIASGLTKLLQTIVSLRPLLGVGTLMV
jgi:predicted membrane GTPase involved in stress response